MIHIYPDIRKANNNDYYDGDSSSEYYYEWHGCMTIAPKEDCPATPKLTQTLTLTRGN